MRFDQVPLEVWDALSDIIHAEGLEYADNFRACRVRDLFLVKEFKAARDEGCCGSVNRNVWVGSEEWVVGCNYGH